MGILSWVVFGLLAGFVAKALMPGRDQGLPIPLILGMGGAIFGGIAATMAGFGGFYAFDSRSLLAAIAASVAMLGVHRHLALKQL